MAWHIADEAKFYRRIPIETRENPISSWWDFLLTFGEICDQGWSRRGGYLHDVESPANRDEPITLLQSPDSSCNLAIQDP
jgi:hypothetical protein